MASGGKRDDSKVGSGQDVSAKLDSLLAEFPTANLNRKANEIGKGMVKLLADNPDVLNNYPDIGNFVEGLGSYWVNSQNPKVNIYGLESLIIIAEALQHKFKNCYAPTLPHVFNRLADLKETVREKARAYLLKCVEVGAISGVLLIEKMANLINIKSPTMSAEIHKTINEILVVSPHPERSLPPGSLAELVRVETGLLNTVLVTDAQTLLYDLAQIFGMRYMVNVLEKEAAKHQSFQQKRLLTIIDDMRVKSMAESDGPGVQVQEPKDEPDLTIVPKPKKAAVSQIQATPATSKPKAKTTAAMTRPKLKPSKLGEGTLYAHYSGPAGEADENWFIQAFEDVAKLDCSSQREFELICKKIMEDLLTPPEIWERKVDGLRRMRSLAVHLSGYDEEILKFVKEVGLKFEGLLRDLRSQVVREACLTVSYICKTYKTRVDSHTLEFIVPVLFLNVICAAKVTADASSIALRYIFMYVHNPRLIGVLNAHVGNKAIQIKKLACEFLQMVLQNWPINRLEAQIPALKEAIKKGCNDGGGAEGRRWARQAFWTFHGSFPEHGKALLTDMDENIKKQLCSASESGGGDAKASAKPSHPQTVSRSHKPVARMGSAHSDAASRRGIPAIPVTAGRSNSAIDLQAAQRARARQQYAALARQKVGGVGGLTGSLPRPKKDLTAASGPVSGGFANERTGRTRNRVAGVSQSQPSSRSGSPSSRLGYHTYNMPDSSTLGYHGRKGSPRSQGASRETSPQRMGSKTNLNKLFGPSRTTQRPPVQQSRPVMAQKMLAQSIEAENAPLSNTFYDGDLDSLGHKVSPRKTSYRPFEDHSDDSDASSLCSERSFDSYRRTSDSYSWSGSQQRLYRDVWETGVKDISEIISNCESTQWTDRKEGLVGLQSYLQAGNFLTAIEIKRVTECFTKMFMDNHTKVFSLFLDALNELILIHRADLNPWIYVLVTRLLNKLGGDLLGSIQNKVMKSLDIVRESFPTDLQMSAILRFLTDPTQTPNVKVKVAALNYLSRLSLTTDPQNAFPPPSPGQGRDILQAALQRMIGWAMMDNTPKMSNPELRRSAQEAILALFNLNTPQVTLRLANLPEEYQEAAASTLKGRVRRGSIPTNVSPLSPSPSIPQRRLHETEPINPEEVYRSLHKTTAEIQNYKYEAGTEKPPDKDNTTSKDSGISQLSGTEALEEAMEELSIQSSSSSNTTTATLTNRVLTVRDCNGMDTTDNSQQDDGVIDEHEAMRKIVEALKSPPDSDNGENISIVSESEKRASLGQLTRLIRDSSVTVLQENFKALLRILLGNLANDNGRDIQTRILVLTALTELIKKRAMTEYFNHYVELLILKVLSCYKDTSKEVVRSAEACANTIATTLSPVMVIRVLAPLIQTGEYPLNLAAIKMLTRLVDACGKEPIFHYLPDLMPGLIQAYDNQESSVRKSAVFCMVSLHAAIGEEDLKPHLSALNGSKLKLLHLYIRRSQQGSSAPTSPRNHPPPSS